MTAWGHVEGADLACHNPSHQGVSRTVTGLLSHCGPLSPASREAEPPPQNRMGFALQAPIASEGWRFAGTGQGQGATHRLPAALNTFLPTEQRAVDIEGRAFGWRLASHGVQKLGGFLARGGGGIICTFFFMFIF